MGKRLSSSLLAEIEECYLSDDSETYASLSERFSVGKSTLEREGGKRNWSRKRDQQSSDKLLKQSTIVIQSLEKLNPNSLAEFDQFSQKRLLKIIQKGLL